MIKYLKFIHVLLWQKKTRLDNYIYKKEIHILLARECNLSYMLIENVFKFFDCSLLYMLYLSMRDRKGKVEKEGRKKRKKGRGKERGRVRESRKERGLIHVLEIEKNWNEFTVSDSDLLSFNRNSG